MKYESTFEGTKVLSKVQLQYVYMYSTCMQIPEVHTVVHVQVLYVAMYVL